MFQDSVQNSVQLLDHFYKTIGHVAIMSSASFLQRALRIASCKIIARTDKFKGLRLIHSYRLRISLVVESKTEVNLITLSWLEFAIVQMQESIETMIHLLHLCTIDPSIRASKPFYYAFVLLPIKRHRWLWG